MTDQLDTSAAVKQQNPWVYRLGAAGGFLLLVAVVVGLIPPAHSDTTAGSIVNFPSMFGQYTAALMLTIVGTGMVVAGAITAAQDWDRRHA